MMANAAGKKNCFNCSMDDHWVVNCPNLTAAQCKELTKMAHISVSKDVLDGIGFLQNESTNAAVVTTWNTLNPHCLYLDLDSTSSFHQVFTDKHLDHLKRGASPFVLTVTRVLISPPRKDGSKTSST
jgi:hypothetical protein